MSKAFITFGSFYAGGNDTLPKDSSVKRTGAKYTTFPVTIIQYGIGYTNDSASIVRRDDRQYYPMRIRQDDLQFTIQCRSVKQYKALQEAISDNHQKAKTQVDTGVVRFSYPALNLDFLGYITNGPGGIRRFEIAPTMGLNLMMVRDNINTVTSQWSSVDGEWEDIFKNTWSFLDNEKETYTEKVDPLMDWYNEASKKKGGGGSRGF